MNNAFQSFLARMQQQQRYGAYVAQRKKAEQQRLNPIPRASIASKGFKEVSAGAEAKNPDHVRERPTGSAGRKIIFWIVLTAILMVFVNVVSHSRAAQNASIRVVLFAAVIGCATHLALSKRSRKIADLNMANSAQAAAQPKDIGRTDAPVSAASGAIRQPGLVATSQARTKHHSGSSSSGKNCEGLGEPESPAAVPPLLQRARELYKNNKHREAEAVLNELFRISKQNGEGLYCMALIRKTTRQFDSAVGFLQQCLALPPQNLSGNLRANAYYHLGEICEQLHDTAGALVLYRQALEPNPRHAGAINRIENLKGRATQQASSAPNRANATPMISNTSVAREPGFYELIQNDPSPIARQVVTLIERLTMNTRPRLSALLGRMLMAAALGVIMLIILSSSFDKHAEGLKICICIALGICISCILISIWRVKTTDIRIDRGRLLLTKGILSRHKNNLELYRILDIDLHQTLLNRLTRDGQLVFVAESTRRGASQTMRLIGLAEINKLNEIHQQMRDLVALLRSGNWGKGIIY